MRFPWIKRRTAPASSQSPEESAAIACVIGSERIAISIIGLEGHIDRTFWAVYIETVCCALHLLDRGIVIIAPELRDARMEDILAYTHRILTSRLQELNGTRPAEAETTTRNMLFAYFNERSSEYEQLGRESVKLITPRYAKHVSEALGYAEDSDEAFQNRVACNAYIDAIMATIMESAPDLFRHP